MPDMFTPEQRCSVMRSIRSKNSQAELLTFRYLRSKGVYFQKHYRRAPGTPDIALPRKKKACFIDGDFWHGKRLTETIERRGEDDYWTQKILKNIERDAAQREQLISEGWVVLAVWESDIKRKRTRSQTLELIEYFLASNDKY